MKKGIIKKIGESEFSRTIMCDIVDTHTHTWALIGTGLLGLVSIICFWLLPMCRYQPFHWDIPTWMINNEPMRVVGLIAAITVIVHGLVVLFLNHCWNTALFEEEEPEAC